MQTIVEYIDNYFEEHKNDLQSYYTGIKKLHLLSMIKDYYFYKEGILVRDAEPMLGEIRNIMKKAIKQVEIKRPFAYISGITSFYSFNLFVNSSVLIPRPETEYLTELFIGKIRKKFPSKEVVLNMADVGCGSGAISLAIAIHLDRKTEIDSIDISEEALKVAKRNVYSHEYLIPPESSINLIRGDRLINRHGPYHAIVSNPPYIPSKEKDNVHDIVVNNEPWEALFINTENYNKWYSTFFIDAFNKLVPGGVFMIEGYENKLSELKNISTEVGFESSIIKDLAGCERFLLMIKSN